MEQDEAALVQKYANMTDQEFDRLPKAVRERDYDRLQLILHKYGGDRLAVATPRAAYRPPSVQIPPSPRQQQPAAPPISEEQVQKSEERADFFLPWVLRKGGYYIDKQKLASDNHISS